MPPTVTWAACSSSPPTRGVAVGEGMTGVRARVGVAVGGTRVGMRVIVGVRVVVGVRVGVAVGGFCGETSTLTG